MVSVENSNCSAENQEEQNSKTPKDYMDTNTSSYNKFSIFNQKINWDFLWNMIKTWITKPINMALLIWMICVVISGAILFMVITGMLNGVLPKKSQRDIWYEVNNQILNALFTLMCLYQHPIRFLHLGRLIRWSAQEVMSLRSTYCKNGTQKPNERAHISVVIALLHLNCFAQYALCCLNLAYARSNRPISGVLICISIAFGAPVIAGLYSVLSPLGKEYPAEIDEESQNHKSSQNKDSSYSLT